MAHVSVTINGRQYRMACDDGQEQHLGQLAQDFDQRIANLRGSFGEIGDMRLTVMAALIVADELSEMRERIRRTEEELATLKQARTAAERPGMSETELAAAFNSAAERIESAARLLAESTADQPAPPG